MTVDTNRYDTTVPGDPLGIDSATIHGLLHASLENRPVESVVERLERPDGDTWLEATVAAIPLGDDIDPRSALLDGAIGLDALDALKRHGKSEVRRATTIDERDAATLCYLLAIAAGVVHQGTLLSSRPADEVLAALAEIHAVVDAPWSEFLLRALTALEAHRA